MNYQDKRENKNRLQNREEAKATPSQRAHTQFQKFGKCVESEVDDNYQDTMTKPMLPSKMHLNFEDEETKRTGWEKGFSTANKAQIKKDLTKANNNRQFLRQNENSQQISVQIPPNAKVEQILNKKPLRERFSGLLPLELELPISFDHQQLLKRMDLVDINMDFLTSSRGSKVLFFDTIKKSIYKNTSILVQLKHLQQLLFLDENCYGVEWKMNDKINRYDIKITLPRIGSMDQRRLNMRKKIVQFLIVKQAEFLAQNNIEKIQHNKWHDRFDYKKVKIPEKPLPVHPNEVNTEIRALPDHDIERVQNNTLKNLFKSKKQQSDIKSLSSASVADMIFSRVPSKDITSHIIELIKQREKQHVEQIEKKKDDDQKIDKQALLKIYDQILMIYMWKNVSNMFKATLIDLAQQRLKFKNQFILKYIDILLDMKQVQFFNVVESSKKVKVVQINKNKFKTGRSIIEQKVFE